MKRKNVFLLLAVAGIVAIAMFNVRLGSQSRDLGDVVLRNVDALASSETYSVGCCGTTGLCSLVVNGVPSAPYPNLYPCSAH
jgi:hypothetical protein